MLVFFLIALQLITIQSASFTTKNIGQSTPITGSTNTITVTLVTDTALTAAGSSVVTISGLSGAISSSPVTLLDKGDDGETIFSDGTTQGLGAWSSGILTLSVYTGLTMSANTIYTFGFHVTNPSSASASPEIYISSSGSATIGSSEMIKPGGDKYGITTGGHPLLVVAPIFSTKSIVQSTPVPGVANTLTVTIKANYELMEGATVTITNLIGSTTASTSDLAVITCSNKLGTQGKWNENTRTGTTGSWNNDGTLILTASSTVAANTPCVMTFQLINPNSNQTSPSVSVEAALTDGTSRIGLIAKAAMTKPGGVKYGIIDGEHPLLVVVPKFSIKIVQQSTYRLGQWNTITVRLRSDYALADQSSVTLRGLKGSQTRDSKSLGVSSTNNYFSSYASWNRAQGQLLLVVSATEMPARSDCILKFELQNPTTPQTSPAVTVRAEIKAAGQPVASIDDVEMDVTLAHEGYQRPFLVIRPEFSLLQIQQTSCLTWSSNWLIIHLQTSFTIPNQALLMLDGLQGIDEADGRSLVIEATPSLVVMNASLTGGTVAMRVVKQVSPTTLVSLKLAMRNGLKEQAPPALTMNMSAVVGGGFEDIIIVDTKATLPSALELFGVANCKQPLLMIQPKIESALIHQSNPLVLASNVVEVQVSFNVYLTPGSTISIVGLEGSSINKSNTIHLQPRTHDTSLALDPNATWKNVQSTSNRTRQAMEIQLLAQATSKHLHFEFMLQNGHSARTYQAIVVLGVVKSVGALAHLRPFSNLSDGKPVEMSTSTQSRLGVPQGALPLYLVIPAFKTKVMVQSSPLSGFHNILTLTLSTSVDLSPGSTVQVRGLTGILNEPMLNLTCTPPGIENISSYRSSPLPSTIELYVGRGLKAYQNYTIRIAVTNGLESQSSPKLAVCATIEAGLWDSRIDCAQVVYKHECLMRVPKASNPLTVVKPSLTMAIEQSTPIISVPNTISIRLAVNVPLDEGTIIFVDGLTGALHESVSESSVFSWSWESDRLKLVVKSGFMLLTANKECICADQTNRSSLCDSTSTTSKGNGSNTGYLGSHLYNLTLLVDNGPEPQTAPEVFIKGTAVVENEKGLSLNIEMQATPPSVANGDAYGVKGGMKPMMLVRPYFQLLGPFYQSNAFRQHVDLQLVVQMNVDLPAGSQLTFHSFKHLAPARAAKVSCSSTCSMFAPHAQWLNTTKAFVVKLVSSLHAHNRITIQLSFNQIVIPVLSERERVQDVMVDARIAVGAQAASVALTRAELIIDIGNLAPTFKLTKTLLVVVDDGVVFTPIAKEISAGPLGIYVAAQAGQSTTFSVAVVESTANAVGLNATWRPIFHAGKTPHVSDQGLLTFSLALVPEQKRLLEHQSGAFQLAVTLRDDGGVRDGGIDATGPKILDVLVIGTPQAVLLVESALSGPLALRVDWNVSAEAMLAHNALTPPRGRVREYLVELRLGAKSVAQVAVPFLVTSHIFHGLRPGRTYNTIVQACNELVCSIGTQAPHALTALDLPSPPSLRHLLRRSETEILVVLDPPTDIGYGAGTSPEGALQQLLKVRLRVSDMNPSIPLDQRAKALAWAEQSVLTFDEYPALFSSGGQQQLGIQVVNAVGESTLAQQAFKVAELQCESRCGDGVRDEVERCDDGNVRDGDGCSSVCMIEPGFLCFDPSVPPNYTCLPYLRGLSHCVTPAFVSLKIDPSTTFPGAQNQLLVSFVANFDILEGVDVLFSNLRGSDTADNANMPLLCPFIGASANNTEACLVESTGVWRATWGILTFRVKRRVPAYALVAFILTLTNPEKAQPTQTLLISCEACCANAPWMFVKSLLQETTALGVQLEASRCAHVNMTSLLLSSPTSTSLSRLNASSSTDPTASSPSAATGVFGPACDLLCFGRVSGASCRCAPNYFGFDCSLYAPPDSTRSFSTTVRAGELAALGVVPAPLRRDANAKSSAASWTHRVVGQTRRDSSPRLEGYSRRAEGAEAGTYVGMVIPGGALLATTLIRAEVYPVKPLVSPSQANMTSRCNIVQLRPHGLVFAEAVTVYLTIDLLTWSHTPSTSSSLDELRVDVMFLDEWSVFTTLLPHPKTFPGGTTPGPLPSVIPSPEPAASGINTNVTVSLRKTGEDVLKWIGVGLGAASGAMAACFVLAALARRRKAAIRERKIILEKASEEQAAMDERLKMQEVVVKRDQAQRSLQETTPSIVTADLVELRDVSVHDVQMGRSSIKHANEYDQDVVEDQFNANSKVLRQLVEDKRGVDRFEHDALAIHKDPDHWAGATSGTHVAGKHVIEDHLGLDRDSQAQASLSVLRKTERGFGPKRHRDANAKTLENSRNAVTAPHVADAPLVESDYSEAREQRLLQRLRNKEKRRRRRQERLQEEDQLTRLIRKSLTGLSEHAVASTDEHAQYLEMASSNDARSTDESSRKRAPAHIRGRVDAGKESGGHRDGGEGQAGWRRQEERTSEIESRRTQRPLSEHEEEYQSWLRDLGSVGASALRRDPQDHNMYSRR